MFSSLRTKEAPITLTREFQNIDQVCCLLRIGDSGMVMLLSEDLTQLTFVRRVWLHELPRGQLTMLIHISSKVLERNRQGRKGMKDESLEDMVTEAVSS